MKALSFLIATLSVCLATASPPTPVIKGPTERHPGALTFLDANESTGAEQYGWEVNTSQVNVPTAPSPDLSSLADQLRAMGFKVEREAATEEPLWAVSEDGKRLWLSSYPGVYVVTLGVSNADGVRLKSWKVTVSGKVPIPVPVPVPVPTPTPIPVPVPEDFKPRLAAAVAAVPKAHEEFGRVAKTYETTAAQIDAGLLKTPEQVIGWTAALVAGAAGNYSAAWDNIDLTIIKPHLATKTLTTAADYAPAWREIAEGVKAGLVDTPPPEPTPTPTPTPTPVPVQTLHVLIVEEMDDRTAGKLPRSQVEIFTSTELVDYFNAAGASWRMFDEDADQSRLPEVWRKGMAKVSESGVKLPAVLISNGSKGTIAPLPTSVADLKALIDKYK